MFEFYKYHDFFQEYLFRYTSDSCYIDISLYITNENILRVAVLEVKGLIDSEREDKLVKKAIDDFMKLLKSKLVIEEDYEEIRVSPIESRYNNYIAKAHKIKKIYF